MMLSLAAAIAAGSVLAVTGPAGAQLPAEDPRTGLVYDGLRKGGVESLCGGAFEAVLDGRLDPSTKQILCTHGPDPAPEGVDVREDRGPDPEAGPAPPPGPSGSSSGSVPCYGNGTDGFRVQLVYARGSSSPDRYSAYEASFRSWAARLDRVVDASAAETGGTRHVRFVSDPTCNPVVAQVSLDGAAMSDFTSMVSQLRSLGYSRTDRKYLVWSDANVYCGISEVYVDDSPDPTPGRNRNNGNSGRPGTVGRVDNGCWGLPNMVEAHELAHLLGGVQPSAPHATPAHHCTEESDRLCYPDGSTTDPVRHTCPDEHEALYDCNHDDYFSTAPAPGSYLDTHWNTADSAFLSAQMPSPPPDTTAPGATSTTVGPTAATTTVASTIAPTAATTTVAPPAAATTTVPSPPTTQPAVGGRPSAPRTLSATQPAVGTGVLLSWRPPATGTVTSYRLYRGTSPFSQTLLTTLGNVLGFNDASAGRTLYYYRVAAVSSAGEGPSSTLTGMIGRTTTSAGTVGQERDRRFVISTTQLRSPWARRWA